jgi:hypothetical protein
VQAGADYIVQNGYVQPAAGDQKSPTQPSGFAPLPSREKVLPTPQSKDKAKKAFTIIKGGKASTHGSHIEVDGPALHCQYQGYDIFADKLTGDQNTQVFDLTGNAKLVGKDGTVKGDFIEADFKKKTFRATKGNADFKPSAFGGKTKDDTYLKGAEIHGDQQDIKAKNGILTTCPLDKPHFELDARDIDVKPNQRAILRHVTLIVLGKRLLTVPYVVIPLNDRSGRYLPQVGRDSQRGYYILTKTGFELPKKDTATLLLDEMSLLGTGLGGQYDYRTRNSMGEDRLYGIIGNTDTFDLLIRHQQRFGNLMFSTENTYMHDDPLSAPTSTVLTNRLQMTLTQPGGTSTALSFYHTLNDQAGFSSSQQTLTVTDLRNFSKALKSNLNLSWVDSLSSFSSTQSSVSRDELDVNFKGTDDLPKATAEFDYQKAIPIGTSQNFINSADRTPVLTFSSDAMRLLGAKRDTWLPFQTQFSVGDFVDPSTNGHVTREAFSLQFQHGSAGAMNNPIGMGALGGYSSGYGGYGGVSSGYTGATGSTFGSGTTGTTSTGSAFMGDTGTQTGAGAASGQAATGTAGTSTTGTDSSQAGAAQSTQSTLSTQTTDAAQQPAVATTSNVGGQTLRGGAGTKLHKYDLSFGGRFDQDFYSDDSAEYTTAFNSDLRCDAGKGSTVDFRYNYLQSHGYSPLSIDQFGTINLLSLDAGYKVAKSLLVAAESSYDESPGVETSQSRWQAIGMRTEWLPASWFQFRTVTSYDTYNEKVGNVKFDLGYRPGATYLALGAEYDGVRHSWASWNLFLDALKFKRLKMSLLFTYDGYLKEFDAMHFSFTYDLHCAEAVLQILDNPTGFNPGTQVVFMIRLKAFPFDTPFGTGTQGQAIGTGSGGYNY